MPLMLVENQEPNPTILPIPGQDPFVWQTKGDPRGGDVQRLPDDLIDSLPFIKALENGCLRVVDPTPEVAARIEALDLADVSASRRGQLSAAGEAVTATIERRQNRDMVGVDCLGPGPRGQESGCGNQVVQRAARGSEEQPPLCPTHRHMADQFALVEVPASRGQTQATWARVAAR